MTIAPVQSSSGLDIGQVASFTITFGATATAGNILIACIEVHDSGSKSYLTPSGWTVSGFGTLQGASALLLNTYLFQKVSDGTETAVTFVLAASATDKQAGIVLEFSGDNFDADDLWDAATPTTARGSANDGGVVVASFTPDDDNHALFLATDYPDNNPAGLLNPFTTTSVAFDGEIDVNVGGGDTDFSLGVAHKIQTTKTAEGSTIDWADALNPGIWLGAFHEVAAPAGGNPLASSLMLSGVGF